MNAIFSAFNFELQHAFGTACEPQRAALALGFSGKSKSRVKAALAFSQETVQG